MAKYSDAELICLGYCVDKHLDWDHAVPGYEALVRDHLLQDDHTEETVLFELLGSYLCRISPANCKKMNMDGLAFDSPLSDMEELAKSDVIWKSLIGKWRLLIGK